MSVYRWGYPILRGSPHEPAWHGIERVQEIIEKNSEVDDFPIRVVYFYGSFYKTNPLMDGADPYQHTIMKRDALIGLGRSWPESDGAEFIYLKNPDDY